jgi:hypothetical protein
VSFFDLLPALIGGFGRFVSAAPSVALDEPSVLSRSKLLDAPDGVLELVLAGDCGNCGNSLTGDTGDGEATMALSFPVTASEIARRPTARRTLGATFLMLVADNGEERPELSPSAFEESGENDAKNPELELLFVSKFVTTGECDWLIGLSGVRLLELRKRPLKMPL